LPFEHGARQQSACAIRWMHQRQLAWKGWAVDDKPGTIQSLLNSNKGADIHSGNL